MVRRPASDLGGPYADTTFAPGAVSGHGQATSQQIEVTHTQRKTLPHAQPQYGPEIGHRVANGVG